MRLFLSSAVLLTIVSSVFGEPCPEIVKGKKKFLFYYEKVNWFQALLNCSSQGMSLATIESKQEQDMIEATLAAVFTYPSTHSTWLGGADLHKEGEFVWFSTNQPMNYRNFQEGQPNNIDWMGDEPANCVILGAAGHQWTDRICSQLDHFTCEYFE